MSLLSCLTRGLEKIKKFTFTAKKEALKLKSKKVRSTALKKVAKLALLKF